MIGELSLLTPAERTVKERMRAARSVERDMVGSREIGGEDFQLMRGRVGGTCSLFGVLKLALNIVFNCPHLWPIVWNTHCWSLAAGFFSGGFPRGFDGGVARGCG